MNHWQTINSCINLHYSRLEIKKTKLTQCVYFTEILQNASHLSYDGKPNESSKALALETLFLNVK